MLTHLSVSSRMCVLVSFSALAVLLFVSPGRAQAYEVTNVCTTVGHFSGPDAVDRAYESATSLGSIAASGWCPTGFSGQYVVSDGFEWNFNLPVHLLTQKWKVIYYQTTPRLADDTTGQGTCPVGNPINPLSGNKYQTESDYQGKGVLPLEFVRTYNSNTNDWKFSYSANYVGDQLALDDGAKQSTEFYTTTKWQSFEAGSPHGTTGYVAGTPFIFPEDEGKSYAAVSGALVRFTNPEGIIDTFDTANGGRLTRRENPTGQWLTFTYTSGRLTQVTHFSGRTLTLTYDAQGRLATMKDPSNRITSYTWDAQNRLIRATYPDATTSTTDNPFRTYHYENASFPLKLTGITDEAGRRYATFGYDAAGRANLTEHAGGADRHTFVYNLTPSDNIQTNDTVTVTNPLGLQTTYRLHLDGLDAHA